MLSGILGLIGLVLLLTLDVRGYIARHATARMPGLSVDQNLGLGWGMVFFWGFVWPWLLIVLHSVRRLTLEGAVHDPTDLDLQSALGSKVTFKAGSIGNVQTSSGATDSAQVLLRVFKCASDPSGKTEQAGIDAIRKMGAQVDVKTSGGITCMTMVAPANMASIVLWR